MLLYFSNDCKMYKRGENGLPEVGDRGINEAPMSGARLSKSGRRIQRLQRGSKASPEGERGEDSKKWELA